MAVGLLILILCYRKELLIEHLVNPPPTLTSLELGLTKTNAKIASVEKDLNDLKTKASAQSNEAASAKASLSAIKKS